MPPDSETLKPPQFAPRLGAARAWAAVRAGVRDIVRSVHPAEDDAWLAQARLELYWSGTRFNTLVMPVAAFLVAQAVSPWVDAPTRALWWGGVAVVSVATNVLGHLLDRHAPHTLAGLRLRSAGFVLLITLFFCAWCSMSVAFWAPGAVLDRMMLILVLACSMAGCVAVTAMHPAIVTSAVVVHAVFLIGPIAASADRLDRRLAALAAVFTAMIAAQAVALCLRTTRLLRLEHERESLAQEMRAAKEESDRAKGRATAAGQARSQFLSHMSHELRTPMNAILGFSEMIQKKAFGRNLDKYADYAGIIHESGQTLLTLIDNVLNLSKIEGGRFYLRESDVQMKRLLYGGIEQHESRAVEAGVSLCADVQDAIPWVRGDERALRQILANLLSNAVKFTPAGGRVTVFARREPDGRIAFGVQDTGIGIQPEDRADAFERFGRGRHDVTTADRGTGLGLAIVKGFAEAHDGEVQLESEAGRGTRVTVYLPAQRVLAPTALKAAG